MFKRLPTILESLKMSIWCIP